MVKALAAAHMHGKSQGCVLRGVSLPTNCCIVHPHKQGKSFEQVIHADMDLIRNVVF